MLDGYTGLAGGPERFTNWCTLWPEARTSRTGVKALKQFLDIPNSEHRQNPFHRLHNLSIEYFEYGERLALGTDMGVRQMLLTFPP